MHATYLKNIKIHGRIYLGRLTEYQLRLG